MVEHYRTSSESGRDSDILLAADSEYEKADLFPGDERRTRRRIRWDLLLPWSLSLVFLVGIIIQAHILERPDRRYWKGNELEIAQREMSPDTVRIRFTGGLRYNESKQLFRQIEPGIPDYVGWPTPEIDAAWEELVSTTDVFMTDAERQENIDNGGTFGDIPSTDHLYTDPYSGLYQAVPSVFHDLHCLNKIRRAIYIDHYPEDLTDIFWPHIQHCMDTIRQSLMCTADVTPIPEAYTPYKPGGSLEPIFQVYHVCRDYQGLQEWAKTRDALDEQLWRGNANRLKGIA